MTVLLRFVCVGLCALWLACGAREEPQIHHPSKTEIQTAYAEKTKVVATVTPDASVPLDLRDSGIASKEMPCPETVPDGMRCVTGGNFTRGSDTTKHGRPAQPVWVQSFLMDTNEMSWERYERCIKSGNCKRPIRFPGFMRPSQPAIAMHFKDAAAACAFEGKRLATSAEWERAARGPENTLYPWGDEVPTCEHAHIKDRSGRGCGTDVTRDVGTGTPGHWGIQDLVGNVDEWVSDWYAPCYSGCEKACGEACLGDDPKGPCGGSETCDRKLRVVRGGSWWWPASYASATEVRGKPPHNTAPHRFGVRCVQDLASNEAASENTSDESSTGL